VLRDEVRSQIWGQGPPAEDQLVALETVVKNAKRFGREIRVVEQRVVIGYGLFEHKV